MLKVIESLRPPVSVLTRGHFGLVTHDAHSASVHTGESHHDIFGVVWHNFKEVPIIRYLDGCMKKKLFQVADMRLNVADEWKYNIFTQIKEFDYIFFNFWMKLK